MSGSQVVKATTVPVVPAELHGFSLTVGLGPYPPDAPRSHRKAMYAELLPITTHARAVLDRMGRERILAISPLTPQAAEAIRREPQGRLAEIVATQTLRLASGLAKQVETA